MCLDLEAIGLHARFFSCAGNSTTVKFDDVTGAKEVGIRAIVVWKGKCKARVLQIEAKIHDFFTLILGQNLKV